MTVLLAGFFTACGDYGSYNEESGTRTHNYIKINAEGTKHCTLSYSNEKVTRMDFLWGSSSNNLEDDGYEEVEYNGNQIIMYGYYPSESGYAHETTIKFTYENGQIAKYEFIDLIDAQNNSTWIMNYDQDKIIQLSEYYYAEGTFKHWYNYTFSYENGVFTDMVTHFYDREGTQYLEEQTAFDYENGRMSDNTTYEYVDGEFFPKYGQIRDYEDDYLTDISYYDYMDGEWIFTGQVVFEYDENGNNDKETYSESGDDWYSYDLEYEKGEGNFEDLNLFLFDFVVDFYWGYPFFKSGTTDPKPSLRRRHFDQPRFMK